MLLDFKQSQDILKRYGIPIAESFVVENETELFEALKIIEFPLVMKTDSKEVVHKTDQGGVILNIKSKEKALKALEKLLEIGKDKVIVQRQVKGEEVIIGGKKDPIFGPVVMFGMGGVLVEVYKDIVFRLAPLEKNDALEMIEEIKAKKILEGYRGKEVVNKDELSDIIVKTSQIIFNEEEIEELDFNPVMVGRESVVCDVRIIV